MNSINPSTGSGTIGSSSSSIAPIHNAARLMPIAEKPPIFSGTDFKRWSQKVMFYTTTMGLGSFLREERPPAPAENETDVQVRTNYDTWIHF
ncbi:hypothetical protein OROHE_024841 [Orobanche hederae]